MPNSEIGKSWKMAFSARSKGLSSEIIYFIDVEFVKEKTKYWRFYQAF